MRYFQDTGILMIYGMFSILYVDIDFQFVFGFLCGVILMCAGYFIEKRQVRTAAGLFFAVAGLALLDFPYFIPVVVYIFLRDRQYVFAVTAMFLEIYYFIHVSEFILPFFCFGTFGALLAVLLEKRTEQFEHMEAWFKRSQDDSRERNFLLSEKNKALLEKQDYALYAATLRERNRIAREIHDNVGHVLSRSILLVGAMKTINKEATMQPLIENLDDSLNSAMDSIRNSVHDLHDEAVNLQETVQNLVREFKFCPVELCYDMGQDLPKEIKYCFISITKEALSNVIKHSNASRVVVLMREHPALYQLCIEDNGTVSGRTSSQSTTSGIGLVNMQERVRTLNGTFQTMNYRGFKIFVTIPKEL